MDLSPISLIDVAAASAVAIKQLQGARSVTAKVVDAAILSAAKEAIEDTLTAELSGELESALEMHTLMNGERAGGGSDPDDWESQLDDAVAELFKAKLEPFTGPGFVGEHSVDTRIHEPGRIDEFARTVAKGVADRMAKDEAMAEQIASLFDKEALTKAGKEKPKDDGYKSVVVIVLADYIAKHNPALGDLLETLDLAADDEPILAAGPLEIIAENYVNKEEIGRCMRVWKANSASWRNEAIEAATTANTPPQNVGLPAVGAPEAAMSMTGEPVETPKPKRTRKKKDAPAAAETDEEREARELAELIGDMPVVEAAPRIAVSATQVDELLGNGTLTALRGIKEHGRITETELAEKLGLSRSTINNMVREKISCDLSPEQRKVLAEAIDAHLKGLAAARAALGAV